MKTNYAQQLAWFEHTVKPHVLTRHSSDPIILQRLSQATDDFIEQSSSDREDLPHHTPTPNKRSKVEGEEIEEHSPFITTMQDDLEDEQLQTQQTQANHSPISIPDSEICTFDSFIDNDLTLTTENEIATMDLGGISYAPMRTSSELSLYYDAHDNWNHCLETIVDNEKVANPSPSSRREKIESVLREKFKLKCFIPNQYDAITAAIDQNDIFILLPAGPSRNLCFQMPVFFQKQPSLVTIILAPALMNLLEKDDHTMETHNIPTLFVTNSKKTHKKNWITRSKLTLKVIRGTQLLFMTYSDFSKCESSLIQAMYKDGLIARFVIDEAHCISQWMGSDDFNFGYSKTTQNLRRRYPNIPLTALTAISNERTHLDIIHHLGLQAKDCKIYKKSILL